MIVRNLRERIIERLDPISSWDPLAVATHSDFDLNPEFRPASPPRLREAAVLAPIIARPEGLTILLTRRADTLSSHTGQVAFPGGRCDPGETPWETALRESEEEIGLDRGLVTLAGLSTPYRTGTNFLVTPVVGFVDPDRKSVV